MRPPLSRQLGVTLIEVLIAIVVLGVGLLGIAALQASALTNNSVSYQYTQVATLAQSIVERMRANRSAVIDPAQPYKLTTGSVPTSPTVDCSAGPCTPAQTAQFDLAVWYSSLRSPSSSYAIPATVPAGAKALLPTGSGSVVCIDGAACTPASSWLITIYWDSDRTGRSGANCDPTSSTDLNCYRLVYRP